MSQNNPKRRKLEYEKCAQCRRDKKKCTPKERQWPEAKCDRCVDKGFECGPSSRKGGGVVRRSTSASPADAPTLVDSLVTVLRWASGKYEDTRNIHRASTIIESILAIDDASIDSAVDRCWEEILAECKAIHEDRDYEEFSWYSDMPNLFVCECHIAETIIEQILSRPYREDSQKKALLHWLFHSIFLSIGKKSLTLLLKVHDDFYTQDLASIGTWKGYLLYLTIQHQLWDDAVMLARDKDTDINFSCGGNDSTVIHAIACHGDNPRSLDVLRILLEETSLRVNETERDGLSALMTAVWKGSIGVIKLLLGDKRVDSNMELDGETAFDTIFYTFKDDRETFIQIIDLFLSHENKTNFDLIDYEYIFDKVEVRHVDGILKRSKLDINGKLGRFGVCVLHTAVRLWDEPDDVEKIKLLLSHPDIDLNIEDEDGNTAAMLAIASENTVFGFLLQDRITALEQERAKITSADWIGLGIDVSTVFF